MLSKSLFQFSVDGWGCVPSLLFNLRSNYGRSNEDNGDLPQNGPCMHCCTQCPHTSARDSWTLPGKSGLVSCGITASFSLGPGVYKILFVPFISLFPQSYVSSSVSMKGLMVPPPRGLMPPPRGLMPYPGLLHSEPLPLL